ncbi:tRNA (mo5U34)-methyltransferase [Sulfurovum sp. enrichment culture clone C5]|uniref:tRNA (Mo5U34)-methyltransferase n=1 Tax=Sulfurovum sp. enrichment culture clone C5 TaxID=497650 RepID=A0A0S4XM88_9BACT|nr:tRNA (mo5U34)-methyltransferase [Sulfurovum sp. enrichment culture clone C5]
MHTLDSIRNERLGWLKHKNVAHIIDEINTIDDIDTNITIDDIVAIEIPNITIELKQKIEKIAVMLKPWRKGPFKIDDLFIDSEWQSFIKYNLLKPHFDIKDKIVGDIGCNNGYYLFRMLEEKPKKLIGFDPSNLFFTQFSFINHFVKSEIVYEMLGVEHVGMYEHKFDTLFCLGVLYHRSDPISTLKSLYQGLNAGGELILDTFIIDGEDDIALTPLERYSKIPNIYFIPTVNALKNWCYRAGFKSIELLEIKTTDLKEQRKTQWIDSQSLEDFLDSNDSNLTVEGYPAPKRAYIKAKKA